MAVVCPVCGEELEGEEAVSAHDHEVPLALENAGAGFECPWGDARFDTEEELVAHEATAHR